MLFIITSAPGIQHLVFGNFWRDLGNSVSQLLRVRHLVVGPNDLIHVSTRSIFTWIFFVGLRREEEVANITGLVQPVPYVTGEFLAAVQVPAVFPASSTTRTSVRLIREYGRSEVSLGSSVVLTEAGMFSDGDPASNWAVGSKPTDYATSSGDAPFFYKTFEPVTNTPDLTLRLTWEVRFV